VAKQFISMGALLAGAVIFASCGGGGASLSSLPSSSSNGASSQSAVTSVVPGLTDLDSQVASGYVRYACPSVGRIHCLAVLVTQAGMSAFGYQTVVRPDDVAAGLRPDHSCHYDNEHHISAPGCATPSPAPTPTSTSPGEPKGAYGPASLQAAYNIDPSGGAGRVVAVIESGDAPTLEADLGVYRSEYGLPPCTTANGCFRKVNETGGSALPKVDADWAQETSLDVDMVSALCPNCGILVVEAAAGGESQDLDTAVNTAASMGAVAISNSYGGTEYSKELSVDGPAYDNHPGVFVTASAGDAGYGTEEPAVFPNVIAVGGTDLSPSASTARGWTETVWSDSGSGCSAYIPKPTWQTDTGCRNRTANDVAFDADPNTGVALYDSTKADGVSGWLVAGGTSVGAPAIAAIYALVGNGLSNASSLYANTADLFDITSGSDGRCSPAYLCTGEVGYDGPTGNGTPNGTGAF